MSQILGLDPWLVVARAAHFGACFLLFSVFAFDRFVAHRALGSQREDWDRIARVLIVIAIPAALLSGILWFVRVAIEMGGASSSIGQVMPIVWAETQFGTVWKVRLVLWAAACLLAIWAGWNNRKAKWSNLAAWIGLVMSGLLALSLAWAGHGATGRAPLLHLVADVLHLLAAGLWPTGLLPFLLLLIKLRRLPQPQRWPPIAALTSRFSLYSLVAASLLAATGIINSCCLIRSFSELYSTSYGRVLLVKISLFIMMIGIGAVNLLILKPRLNRFQQSADIRLEGAATQLQWQVLAEVVLGCAVLIVVGILGLLPPALE